MDQSLPEKIAALRQEYRAGTLRREDLADSPFDQFGRWFDEAVSSEIREANAMTLATLGLDGIPTARTVLMKDFTDSGVTFFTNYDSRKGREITANPNASVLFFWKELERQVQVRGTLSKTSPEASDAYYRSRPYNARIGAWASQQSSEIPDREWLASRAGEFEERFPDDGTTDCVPRPDFWGGYSLVPELVEFWQGQPGRKHDRFVYRRSGGTWTLKRLSP